MDSIAAREAKHDKKNGHMDSTLKDIYKIIWKLKYVKTINYQTQIFILRYAYNYTLNRAFNKLFKIMFLLGRVQSCKHRHVYGGSL